MALPWPSNSQPRIQRSIDVLSLVARVLLVVVADAVEVLPVWEMRFLGRLNKLQTEALGDVYGDVAMLRE
jgi:hypothetical protein